MLLAWALTSRCEGKSGEPEANQQLVSLTPLNTPVDVSKGHNWAKQIKLLLVRRHERRRMKGLQDHRISYICWNFKDVARSRVQNCLEFRRRHVTELANLPPS